MGLPVGHRARSYGWLVDGGSLALQNPAAVQAYLMPRSRRTGTMGHPYPFGSSTKGYNVIQQLPRRQRRALPGLDNEEMVAMLAAYGILVV